jgi:hypothetical protein
MGDSVYRQAFDKAKADLGRTITKKLGLEKSLTETKSDEAQLRRTLAALAPLCGENIEDTIGITEGVRLVFRTNVWRTAKEVADQIQTIGVSLADLQNPLASILSVLNRLTNSGELQTATRKTKAASGIEMNLKVWRAVPSKAQQTQHDDDIPF